MAQSTQPGAPGTRGGFRAPGLAGAGFGVLDGGLTYFDRRSEHPDESRMTSAAIAGVTAAAWAFVPGVMWAKTAYDVTKSMGQAGMFSEEKMWHQKAGGHNIGAGWNYQDTQQNATMRQRGMQAIQDSRALHMSTLGGEARSLHRGAL